MLARRDAGEGPKAAVEIALVRETDFVCDLGTGQPGFLQQTLGLADSHLVNVLQDRPARPFLDQVSDPKVLSRTSSARSWSRTSSWK